MKDEILNQPLEDKKLAEQIRRLAADRIKWLLSQNEANLMPDEKKLKHDILRSLAPNMFPKPKVEEDSPTDEETKLTPEQEKHLNKILNG